MADQRPGPIPLGTPSPSQSDDTKAGLTTESIVLSDFCPPAEIQKLIHEVSVDDDVPLWKLINMINTSVKNGDIARMNKDYERSLILYARTLFMANKRVPLHPEHSRFLQGMTDPKYMDKEHGNQWDKFRYVTGEKIKVLVPLVLARYEERKADKQKKEKAEAEASARKTSAKRKQVSRDLSANPNKRRVSEVIATPFTRMSQSFKSMASRSRATLELGDPDWNKHHGGASILALVQSPSASGTLSTSSPISEDPPHTPFAETASPPHSATYPPKKRRKAGGSLARDAPALYAAFAASNPAPEVGGNETLGSGGNSGDVDQDLDKASRGSASIPDGLSPPSTAPTHPPSTPNVAPTARPRVPRQASLTSIFDYYASPSDVDNQDPNRNFDDVPLPTREEIQQMSSVSAPNVLSDSPESSSVALASSRQGSRVATPTSSRSSSRPSTPSPSLRKPPKLNFDTLSVLSMTDDSDGSECCPITVKNFDPKGNPDVTFRGPCTCGNKDPLDTFLTDSDEESQPDVDDDDDDDDSISGEIVDFDDARQQLSSSLALALEALNYMWQDYKSQDNPPPLAYEEVFSPLIENRLRKIVGFAQHLKD